MLLTEPRISKPAAAWRQWEGKLVEGRFRLAQFLGCTGYSAVFLTTRAQGEPAAIKLVLPESVEAGARQLQAWELAAKAEHPNLGRLFERGEGRVEETPLVYIVTEYAEENLAQILPERALTVPETRELLGAVVSALSYLHAEGFAHGHLKPSNVLAMGDQLKLSADSICRFSAEDLVGGARTIYDAPELVGGTRTAAGDVWSLGAVLCEALTQRPELREGDGLAAPFEEIARGCLARNPQERWGVAQVGAALRKENSKEEVPTPGVTRSEQSAPVAQRSAKPTVVPRISDTIRDAALTEGKPASLATEQEASDGSGVRKPLLLGLAGVVLLAVIFAAVQLLHRRPTVTPGTSGPVAAAAVVADAQTAPAVAARDAGGGAAVHEVVPDVPHAAAATIHGTIKVRVRVETDGSGAVTDSHLVHSGTSKYFDKLALTAAREWVFAPGVGSARMLQFEFRRNGTHAEVID